MISLNFLSELFHQSDKANNKCAICNNDDSDIGYMCEVHCLEVHSIIENLINIKLHHSYSFYILHQTSNNN